MSPFPNISLSIQHARDRNTDLDAVPPGNVYIHQHWHIQRRSNCYSNKSFRLHGPHVRHERSRAPLLRAQRFRVFKDGDAEFRDRRLDAGQGWVVGKAHVKDASVGGIVDERDELADHFGVGRRPFSRYAFRERVPDCPVTVSERRAGRCGRQAYSRKNQTKTDGNSTLHPQYIALTLTESLLQVNS